MIITLFIVFLSFDGYLSTDPYACKCAEKSHCKRVDTWKSGDTEVIVMTNHSHSYTEWLWESLTTVITYNDIEASDIMCYTHSMGKKYGFYLNTFPLNYKDRPEGVGSFINATKQAAKIHFADVLALDLNPLLGRCDYAKAHVPDIVNVTQTVINGIKKDTSLKVLCVMPWMPPCYDSDCSINPTLASACDGVILSPESYNTFCEESCVAKATVPFSKLNIGVIEYLAAGYNQSKLIVGIPWHGYNYSCTEGTITVTQQGHFICHLKKTNDTCDLNGSRQKVPIGVFQKGHPAQIYDKNQYSKGDEAPWIIYSAQDGNVTSTSIMWYEDLGSLEAKYMFVHDKHIKGMAIYFGEDLTYTKVNTNKQFNSHMWAWLLHTTLSTGPGTVKKSSFNFAGTAAGIGVGMFVFGVLLGTIISCVIFRRQRRLRPPFSHDPMNDEYHDDTL